MQKFFNFVNSADNKEADLYISGDIVSNDCEELYDFFGIECTVPKGFKEQLAECNGKPINIYIDSYGGDVIAASAIYTMISEYKGQKTVKISSIAASAASIIAMAGDKILMSPTAFLMIHDPSTAVRGNITEVKQTLDSLKVVKEAIINAYERKSNLSREKISSLMTNETWLDYNDAKEYGFCDGLIENSNSMFSKGFLNSLKERQICMYNSIKPQKPPEKEPVKTISDEEKRRREREVEVLKLKYNIK